MPPKKSTYSTRDQMQNLDRQDKRQKVDSNDSDMEIYVEGMDDLPSPVLAADPKPAPDPTPAATEEEDEFLYASRMLKSFKDNCPKYLLSIISKLSEKYAAIRCSIRNLEHKIFSLAHALDSASVILPDCLARYRKEIDGIDDIDEKSTRILQLITTTKNGYEQKKNELLHSYNGRESELSERMEPFTAIKDSLKNSTFDFAYVLNLLIEERVCLMIQKQLDDDKKKQDKKDKLNLLKEKNSAVKELSVKEFSQMRKEIDNLKKQLQKQKTSKNVKGNPQQKKGGKPKAGNANSKPGKGNGNLRGSKGKKK